MHILNFDGIESHDMNGFYIEITFMDGGHRSFEPCSNIRIQDGFVSISTEHDDERIEHLYNAREVFHIKVVRREYSA
jgi:hypothetical protein